MDAWPMALTITLTTAAMAFLARQSRRPPPTLSDGAILLRYQLLPRLILACGSLGMAALSLVCAYLIVAEQGPLSRRILGAVVLLPAIWLARFSWLERRTTVLCDADGIRAHTWRNQLKGIAWSELTEMRWSSRGYWWRLDASDGTRIRVNGMLQGTGELLTLVRKHVPESRWRRWRSDIERFQKQHQHKQ